MKIVSFKICPFVQRVTALLEAKGLDYDLEFISLSNKPQWFLDISPNAQVPLLITDEGEALFESDAIVEQLKQAKRTMGIERTKKEKPAKPDPPSRPSFNGEPAGFDWLLWGVVLVDGALLAAIFGPMIRRRFE